MNHNNCQHYLYIFEFYVSQIFYHRIVFQKKLRISEFLYLMDFDAILSQKSFYKFFKEIKK